jgi:hypothetical protein
MSRGPLIYDKIIQVKVTTEQDKELVDAATKVGMTKSTLIRSAILKEKRRILRLK